MNALVPLWYVHTVRGERMYPWAIMRRDAGFAVYAKFAYKADADAYVEMLNESGYGLAGEAPARNVRAAREGGANA